MEKKSLNVRSQHRLFQEAPPLAGFLFIVGVGNGRSGKVTRGDQAAATVNSLSLAPFVDGYRMCVRSDDVMVKKGEEDSYIIEWTFQHRTRAPVAKNEPDETVGT